MRKMLAYLADALASFDRDPPSSDFQRGYLAAVKEINVQANIFAKEGDTNVQASH